LPPQQPPDVAAVRFDDRIHQSGGVSGKRDCARRFFYCFVRKEE